MGITVIPCSPGYRPKPHRIPMLSHRKQLVLMYVRPGSPMVPISLDSTPNKDPYLHRLIDPKIVKNEAYPETEHLSGNCCSRSQISPNNETALNIHVWLILKNQFFIIQLCFFMVNPWWTPCLSRPRHVSPRASCARFTASLANLWTVMTSEGTNQLGHVDDWLVGPMVMPFIVDLWDQPKWHQL